MHVDFSGLSLSVVVELGFVAETTLRFYIVVFCSENKGLLL